MKKNYSYFILILLFSNLIFSQTTETFETEIYNSTAFSDNGKTFTITSQSGGTFDIIDAQGIGWGWNGTATDNRFIDNSGSSDIGVPVQFTIKSTSSFNLKSIYLYLSQSNLNIGNGSCTITGKLAGIVVFTATSSSGFNNNLALNNGYTFVNMATYGGTDNSNKTIDEYIITTTGTFEYVALDAMTWKINTLGVDEFEVNALNFYPNPVENVLNLNSNTEIKSAKVINILGQTVLVKNINAASAQIELGTLPAGNYFVEINSAESRKVIKLIKK